MKIYLRLNRGLAAFIDADDFERVSKFGSSICKSGGGNFYAHSTSNKLPKHHKNLANFILQTFPGERVDHKNGDMLDYQKHNLRKCTQRQNSQNTIVQRNYIKTSKFKGVNRTSVNSWRATICGRKIGMFNCEIEAAKAYDRAALERFGEFAKTNEMMGLYYGKDPHDERLKIFETHKVEPDTRLLKREPSSDKYTTSGKLQKAYRCQDGMIVRFTNFEP